MSPLLRRHLPSCPSTVYVWLLARSVGYLMGMRARRDPEILIDKWRGWLDHLEGRVDEACLDDELFWQFDAIYSSNQDLHHLPGDLYEIVHLGYLTRCLVTLRAAVDGSRDTISLVRLLGEMEVNHSIFTRERYSELYNSLGANGRRIADQNFDVEYGARGRETIQKGVFEARSRRLKFRLKPCVDYANAQVTHWSAQEHAQDLRIKYQQIRRGLVHVVDEIHYLRRLVFGSASSDLVPTRQYQWFDALRRPWLSTESFPPQIITLKEVKAEMEREEGACPAPPPARASATLFDAVPTTPPAAKG